MGETIVIEIYIGAVLLAGRLSLTRYSARRAYVGKARGYAPRHRMVAA